MFRAGLQGFLGGKSKLIWKIWKTLYVARKIGEIHDVAWGEILAGPEPDPAPREAESWEKPSTQPEEAPQTSSQKLDR